MTLPYSLVDHVLMLHETNHFSNHDQLLQNTYASKDLLQPFELDHHLLNPNNKLVLCMINRIDSNDRQHLPHVDLNYLPSENLGLDLEDNLELTTRSHFMVEGLPLHSSSSLRHLYWSWFLSS
jgi:hypothetical protein